MKLTRHRHVLTLLAGLALCAACADTASEQAVDGAATEREVAVEDTAEPEVEAAPEPGADPSSPKPAKSTTTTSTVAPTTVPPTTVAPTTQPLAPAAGAPAIAAVTPSATRPSSTDACGEPTFYSPANLLDGQPDTAWMVSGAGIGATVRIDFTQPTNVSQVGLIPGYAKQDPCSGSNRFFDLRRVRKVSWSFNTGIVVEQDFVEDPTLQTIGVVGAEGVSSVTITILVTTEPGLDRLDHTPISELVVS